MEKERPATVYKYQDFTTRSLLSLKSQSVWFGSPKNFNDPYDCALKSGMSESSADQLERIRKHFLNKGNLSEVRDKEIQKMSSDQLREAMERSVRFAIDEQVNDFLSKRGVTCFFRSL